MKNILTFSTVIFLLFSCNNDEKKSDKLIEQSKKNINRNVDEIESGSGWTPEAKKAFIKKCKDGMIISGVEEKHAQDFCECSYFKAIKLYPDEEASKKITDDEITKIANDCAVDIPIN